MQYVVVLLNKCIFVCSTDYWGNKGIFYFISCISYKVKHQWGLKALVGKSVASVSVSCRIFGRYAEHFGFEHRFVH